MSDNAGPRYEVKDGKFFCNDVEVYRWQMTPEELKERFPQEYELKFGKDANSCPVAGCGQLLYDWNAAGYLAHIRQIHPQFWDKYYGPLHRCRSINEVKALMTGACGLFESKEEYKNAEGKQ